MIISHSKKFIFLHPQKTGGTSIQKAIKESLGGTGEYNVPWRHCDATDARAYLGEYIWKAFYKFCIVRNPFIRLVSWYQHPVRFFSKKIVKTMTEINKGKKSEYDRLFGTVEEMREKVRYFSDKKNFPEQIDYWLSDEYKEIISKTKRKFCIFQNLVDWLDISNVKYHHIIRLENIENDWRKIYTEIGILPVKLSHRNFGFLGDSQEFYKKYYTPELIKKVSKIYEKDLEYFGYGF